MDPGDPCFLAEGPLFAVPGLAVRAGIAGARIGGHFEGRRDGLRLRTGSCGVRCGLWLRCRWRLCEVDGERAALPLGWDEMPGYTGVVAAEERAGGIDGKRPAGALDDRECGELAG